MRNSDKNFTVLFITRKFPPMTGGMEHYMHGLISNYNGNKYAVTYGGNQKWLPFIYPLLLIKSCIILFTKHVDLVHMGDGVMTPMGWLIKKIFRKPVTYTAYGKDINLELSIYQKIMPYFLKSMDRVFCISNDTLEECVKIGIDRDSCVFIPAGIDTSLFEIEANHLEARRLFSTKYNVNLEGKTVLMTCGRLSKRKGVQWFIENVFPNLDRSFVYIIPGADGTEINDLRSWLGIRKISYYSEVRKSIKDNGLESRVAMIGKIPFYDLKILYKAADVFVMPNISVKGDKEGFGLVLIEAGYCGTPVVASNIEGIKDAVIDGKTGSLVTEKDIAEFTRQINYWVHKNKTRRNSKQIQQLVRAKYSWPILCDRYKDEFSALLRTEQKPIH